MADAEDGGLQPAETSTALISFGFSRTSAQRRPVGPGDGDGAAPEKDFSKTVEGRELQSVKSSEAPRELIIPLSQNGHRKQPPPQAPGPSAVDGVLSQAVKELTEESKKPLEERQNEGVNPTLAIPMIQKGRTPIGEGADSEPLAEAVPEEANYAAVPVEAYGMAMLRGMGWRPGQGIGRTFNQVVKPCVKSVRPKGLGLGASLTEVQALAPASPHCPPRPDEAQEKGKGEPPPGLVPGGAVLVLSGPHRGRYAKVDGLDPDNVRAVVRLAVGSRVATVSEHCLRPVSQQEFDKNALGPGQANKTSPKQQNEAEGAASGTALPDQDLPTGQDDSERKRNHLPAGQDGPTAKREKAAPGGRHWLHRDLRVRFVEKLHKGGRYYNTKVTVEDVLGPDTCVCRTDEGRVLEGVREDMLETLVPKAEGSRVMVVLGPLAGRVGRLLGRDGGRSQAVVQLRGENRLVQLHYDAVCEYLGPSDLDGD